MGYINVPLQQTDSSFYLMIGMFLWLKMTWYLSWWRHLTHVSHIIDQQVIHSSLNTGSHFWAQQIKQSQYFLLYLSDVCHRCDLVKCNWTLVTLLTLSARPCSRPEDPLLSFSSSFRSLMVQACCWETALLGWWCPHRNSQWCCWSPSQSTSQSAVSVLQGLAGFLTPPSQQQEVFEVQEQTEAVVKQEFLSPGSDSHCGPAAVSTCVCAKQWWKVL